MLQPLSFSGRVTSISNGSEDREKKKDREE
jgi:hypothetical protein